MFLQLCVVSLVVQLDDSVLRSNESNKHGGFIRVMLIVLC